MRRKPTEPAITSAKMLRQTLRDLELNGLRPAHGSSRARSVG